MKRLVILLVSTFSFFSCSNEESKQNVTASDEYYTCSMDPQVIEYKPGNCPICKMPLTKVKKNMGLGANEIELSDQQVQLGNIRTDSVKRQTISSENTITGVVKVNETLQNSISAKVMGRVEKLYFKNPGDFVKKGDLVFELYSEELNVMKQEYLLALKNQGEIARSAVDFKQPVLAAKTKLLLYGLTEQQITELEHSTPTDLTAFLSPYSGYISEINVGEGQYVMLGQEIMKLADLSSLWVEAQAFNTQVGGVKNGGKVLVSFPESNLKSAEGKVEFLSPVSQVGSRITQFRALVDNTGNYLKPGMIAYVDFLKQGNSVLSVPENAVIRNGKENLVWIKTGKNKFKRIIVELGTEVNGLVEIRSGLQLNDEIVVTGAYLINSEYTFKKGAGAMEGMAM